MNQTIKPVLIKNATIHTESEILKRASLLLKDGIIQQIIMNQDEGFVSENPIEIDGTNLHAIPGFIDGHIHGANGHDVMDANERALDGIAAILPQEGITSFLATTITQSPTNIERALANAGGYISKTRQAEMIGIHLEGPFINKIKAGAQPEKYIMAPDIEIFKKWQHISNNKIRTITLAPELDRECELIQYLFSKGVNVSAGHTNAGFQDMQIAASLGVRQLTHLCNAMNGLQHRDIGAVGAAFLLKELRSELIADGEHVASEMLQIIYSNIGSDRIILITDAMRAKYLGEGEFDLGGQPVNVCNGRALLKDGTLAGSILTMQDAAYRMKSLVGASMEDIIKMTSANIAKQLEIYDRKGSIEIGKDADILLVDDDLKIKYTLCRGEIAYKGK